MKKPETTEASGKQGLIDEIREGAGREKENILQEARKKAEERLRSSEEQASSILADARKKLENQEIELTKKSQAAVEAEKRRLLLLRENRLIRLVQEKVRDGLISLLSGNEGKTVILSWIVEAALGLDTPAGEVNCSPEEIKLITPALLTEAEKAVKDISGRDIHLTLTKEAPLRGKGIVITESTGHRAFNNQVSARMVRYDREIRKIIYQEIITQ